MRPASLRGLPLLALLAACGGAAESTEAATLPNPASRHCVEQGGKSEIVQEPGGWRGVGRFPDGRACDEWECMRTGIRSG